MSRRQYGKILSINSHKPIVYDDDILQSSTGVNCVNVGCIGNKVIGFH